MSRLLLVAASLVAVLTSAACSGDSPGTLRAEGGRRSRRSRHPSRESRCSWRAGRGVSQGNAHGDRGPKLLTLRRAAATRDRIRREMYEPTMNGLVPDQGS